MRTWTGTIAALALAAAIAGGCGDSVAPVSNADTPDQELAALEAASITEVTAVQPSPLVTVSVGAKNLTFWPYTGTDFSGKPQDPINLIFFGQTDPRDLRAALMSLDGDRTALGFPPVAPFNSKWDDAIGDVQTANGVPGDWTGSVVQLQCGNYMGPRFHIRFFQIGKWTVASAHFEVLIPGTTDHQVLSWELAEQFVVADFMRSGLLDSVAPVIATGPINQSPFNAIPSIIYNGLPVELRTLIGGPLGDVASDVPMATDGQASILNVAKRKPYQAGVMIQEFVINFGQVIPKPFCSSGPSDYVYVTGPVHLRQTVRLNKQGNFEMSFLAQGDLSVTPVNPLTGEPTGPPMAGFVLERHSGAMNGQHLTAASTRFQRLGSADTDGSGRLFVRLRVSSAGHNGFDADIRCGGQTL
jgi:hypothetical protein